MSYIGPPPGEGPSPRAINYSVDLTQGVIPDDPIPENAIIVLAHSEYLLAGEESDWETVSCVDNGGSGTVHDFNRVGPQPSWSDGGIAYLNSFTGEARKAVPVTAVVSFSGGPTEADASPNHFEIYYYLPVGEVN